VNGLPSGANPAQVKLYLTNSLIQCAANGTNGTTTSPCTLPNAVVTFPVEAISLVLTLEPLNGLEGFCIRATTPTNEHEAAKE
jgi:hypothetical protein